MTKVNPKNAFSWAPITLSRTSGETRVKGRGKGCAGECVKVRVRKR